MFKKIMLLGAAVAAFAALAAPAQAVVTDSNGNRAEVIEAISEDTTSATVNGTIECETVYLAAAYTGGTGHYEGEGEAFGANGNHADPECTIKGTAVKVKITEIGVTVNFEGAGKAKANFTYTYDITHPVLGSIHCTFKGTGVAVTYTATTNGIAITNGKMVGEGGGACAAEGTLNGTFKVFDESGKAVSIH